MLPVTNDTQLREKRQEKNVISSRSRIQCNRSIIAKRVSAGVKIDNVQGVQRKKSKDTTAISLSKARLFLSRSDMFRSLHINLRLRVSYYLNINNVTEQVDY